MNLKDLVSAIDKAEELQKILSGDLIDSMINNQDGLTDLEKMKARNLLNSEEFKTMVENDASELEYKSYIKRNL
jgi:hypothetical protein